LSPSGSRRAAWERNLSRQRAARNSGKGRSAVLLVGAGSAGVMAVREIRSRGEHDMDLRGFVDDDPAKQGAVISGLRVLGPTESLPVLVPALGIDQVIITIARRRKDSCAASCRSARGSRSR